MDIKFCGVIDNDTRWFSVDGVVFGICEDGRLLDRNAVPFSNSSASMSIMTAIFEFIDSAGLVMDDDNNNDVLMDI